MTKQEAKSQGKILMKKLKLKGKRLQVWENMGWYFAVTAPSIRVSVGVNGGFYAMMSPSYAFFSPEFKAFKDPNKAVEYTLKHASKVVMELAQIVNLGKGAAGVW